MSIDAYAWKVERGFQDRWTHGLIVRRAWRVRNRVGIASIAPEAYASTNRFERTTKAILLTNDEQARALSHYVRQVNVFGEEPISVEDLASGPLEKIWSPSHGPRPSFGERLSIYEDGETQVYLMGFDGPPELLFGRRDARPLFKVGRSNDPKRRLGELNCGFPPSAVMRWKMIRCERFTDANTAHDVEREIHEALTIEHCSEGGEFFTGPARDIENTFSTICISKMHKILGAPSRAKGV